MARNNLEATDGTSTSTYKEVTRTSLSSGKEALDVSVLGSGGALEGVQWDYVALTQDATTDTWTFKTGGSGGTTTAVIVITYTDSGKGTISNVERTT